MKKLFVLVFISSFERVIKSPKTPPACLKQWFGSEPCVWTCSESENGADRLPTCVELANVLSSRTLDASLAAEICSVAGAPEPSLVARLKVSSTRESIDPECTELAIPEVLDVQ